MELLERVGWRLGLEIGLAGGMVISLVNRLVVDLASWLISSLADLKGSCKGKVLVGSDGRGKKVVNRRL